jgi:hypothetical protein
MLESEVHTIPEHAVRPSRIFCEKLTGPNDFATTVMDADPEEGKFVNITLDIGTEHVPATGTQKEKAFEKKLI